MTLFKMRESGMYGVVTVPGNVFVKLNSEFFISHSTDTVKYMCVNKPEEEHLKSIGVLTGSVVCDWFKIVLTN